MHGPLKDMFLVHTQHIHCGVPVVGKDVGYINEKVRIPNISNLHSFESDIKDIHRNGCLTHCLSVWYDWRGCHVVCDMEFRIIKNGMSLQEEMTLACIVITEQNVTHWHQVTCVRAVNEKILVSYPPSK